MILGRFVTVLNAVFLLTTGCGYLVPASVPKPVADATIEGRRKEAFLELTKVREALDAAEMFERSVLKVTAPAATTDLKNLSAVTVARMSLEETGPFFNESEHSANLVAKSIVTQKYPKEFAHLGIFPRDVMVSLNQEPKSLIAGGLQDDLAMRRMNLELTDAEGNVFPYVVSSNSTQLDGNSTVTLNLAHLAALHRDINRGEPTPLDNELPNDTLPGRFDLVIGGNTRYIRANKVSYPIGSNSRLKINFIDAKIDRGGKLHIAEARACLVDQNGKPTCSISTPEPIPGKFFGIGDMILVCKDASQIPSCQD